MDRTLKDMLDDATAQTSGDPVVTIGTNWGQGRTTFGGLGAVLGVAALRKTVNADRPLRSLLVNFAAPIPTGATVTLNREILREGGSATVAAVRTEVEGTPATVMQATYGGPRTAVAVEPETAGDMPNEADFELAPHMPMLPSFLQSLDIKWVGNGIPTSGTKDTRLQVFARLKDPEGIDAAGQLITLADTPPPIIMSHYKAPMTGATMSWSLDFVRPLRDWIGGWLYLDYRLISAADGYCQQSGRIYDSRGHLIAVSHQTMAYFEPKL